MDINEFYIRCQCLVQLYREDIINHDVVTTKINNIKMFIQIICALVGTVMFFVDNDLNLELFYSGLFVIITGADKYMEKRTRKFDRDGRNKTLSELVQLEDRLAAGGDETVIEEYNQCENVRTSFSRSVVNRKISEWNASGIKSIPRFLDTKTIRVIVENNKEADEIIRASNELMEQNV